MCKVSDAVYYVTVRAEDEGQRLDNYLSKILKGVPKSHIYRLIRSGQVRINKKRVAVSTRLCEGDYLRIPPVRIAQKKAISLRPGLSQRLQKNIIYEDKDLIVLNKPAGFAVHGGSGLSLGIIEALRLARPDCHDLELAHRLDRETSGCLLITKKRSMLRAIHDLLESRNLTKIYWALLLYPWKGKKNVTVNAALQKNILKSGERIAVVSKSGKPSETKFALLENLAQACLVEAIPKTGRTHQIRVHSTCLGHPIIGDKKYGTDTSVLNLGVQKSRLYLHAKAIQFNLNGKNYYFQADLDDIFSETLAQLRLGSK